MLAARIVDQSNTYVMRPSASRARDALLPDAYGVETDVRADCRPWASRCQVQGLRLDERHLVDQQLSHSFAGCFGNPLDGRFAQTQPTQFVQRDFGRLREAGLHTGYGGHFAGGWRERGYAQTQRMIPRNMSLTATAAMIVTARSDGSTPNRLRHHLPRRSKNRAVVREQCGQTKLAPSYPSLFLPLVGGYLEGHGSEVHAPCRGVRTPSCQTADPLANARAIRNRSCSKSGPKRS